MLPSPLHLNGLLLLHFLNSSQGFRGFNTRRPLTSTCELVFTSEDFVSTSHDVVSCITYGYTRSALYLVSGRSLPSGVLYDDCTSNIGTCVRMVTPRTDSLCTYILMAHPVPRLLRRKRHIYRCSVYSPCVFIRQVLERMRLLDKSGRHSPKPKGGFIPQARKAILGGSVMRPCWR